MFLTAAFSLCLPAGTVKDSAQELETSEHATQVTSTVHHSPASLNHGCFHTARFMANLMITATVLTSLLQAGDTTTGCGCCCLATAPVFVLGYLWGLTRHAAALFVGTYISTISEVSRAGVVADVNAIALVTALNLLFTSRAAFRHAEESTQEVAWRRLVNDTSYACATGKKEYFEGHFCPNLTAVCYLGDQGKGRQQVVESLDGTAVSGEPTDCIPNTHKCRKVPVHTEARLLALVYQLQKCTSAMACRRLPTDAGWTLPVHELANLPRIGQWSALSLLRVELVPDITISANGWTADSSDTIPSDATGVSAADQPSARDGHGKGRKLLQSAVYNHIDPGQSPVSADASLPISETSSDGSGQSPELANYYAALPEPILVISGPEAPSTYCNWSGPVKGECMGSFAADLGAGFCSSGTEAYFDFPTCVPYRCINGASVKYLSRLNDEVTAARQQHRVWYFSCLSYDELFGVYIGIIGVAVTVVLGTFVLYSTDVILPLLKAGAGVWPIMSGTVTDAEQEPHAEGKGTKTMCTGWVNKRFKEGVDMWSNRENPGCAGLNIFLRCVDSILLGLVMGAMLVFAWSMGYFAAPAMNHNATGICKV